MDILEIQKRPRSHGKLTSDDFIWSSRLTVTPRCQQTCKAVLFLDVGAFTLLGVIALRPHISRPSSEDAGNCKKSLNLEPTGKSLHPLTATFHSTKTSLQLWCTVFQICGRLLKFFHPKGLFKSGSSWNCYGNSATEDCKSIVLGVLRQQRPDRHVT